MSGILYQFLQIECLIWMSTDNEHKMSYFMIEAYPNFKLYSTQIMHANHTHTHTLLPDLPESKCAAYTQGGDVGTYRYV